MLYYYKTIATIGVSIKIKITFVYVNSKEKN